MKKITGLVLTIVMLAAMLTAFAVTAMADSEETEKPENAQWLINDELNQVWWELTGDDSSRTLTVGGTGEMPSFGGKYEQPWDGLDSITTVIINSGVTKIGDFAFASCEQIEKVTISEGVKNIGDNAFSCCFNIPNITIPESVESIGSDAFTSCEKIKKVTIPGNVKNIGDNAFGSCFNIVELKISYGVRIIGQSAFGQCDHLNEVIIPESVESIGDSAFQSCSELKKATIPESVKSIGHDAFDNCSPEFVIHGQYCSVAEEYAANNGLAFEASGTCKHTYRLVCNSCQKSVTKSDLLSAWGINTATGSTISGGSLTIICTIAAAAVFGLGGFFIGRKKKKPALAGGAENKSEE